MDMTFRAFIKKYWLQAVAVLCSTAVFLFWIALRVNWAGISKFLGADHNPSFLVMNLPLLICVLMGVILLLTILSFLCIRDKKRWPYTVSLVFSAVFAVAIGVVIANGSNDYIQFILPKFLRSVGVTAGLILVFCLLFFHAPNKGVASGGEGPVPGGADRRLRRRGLRSSAMPLHVPAGGLRGGGRLPDRVFHQRHRHRLG